MFGTFPLNYTGRILLYNWKEKNNRRLPETGYLIAESSVKVKVRTKSLR